MKKLLLFFMYWGLLTGLEAQVWEVPICRQLDESRVKMLKLIPKMELTIRTLKPVMDSVKEEITYKGHLNSGSEGSLNLNLEEYRTVKLYPNGIRQTTTMPPDVYLKNESPGNGIKSIALEDIDFIKVQK